MSTTITNNLIVKQTILREKSASFFNSIFMQFYGIKFPLKIKRIFQAFFVWYFKQLQAGKKLEKLKSSFKIFLKTLT